MDRIRETTAKRAAAGSAEGAAGTTGAGGDDLAVEVRGLTKRYGRFTLDRVDLTLPRGYIMGFIGPNGAGKSTTIRLLMGLARRDAGTVRLLGLDLDDHEREIKNRVGYVGEDQPFYEDLTVAWTARFVSRYYRDWDAGTYTHCLDAFGIDPGKKIKELSRGTRVKFALTLALAHRPELLILDEPASGLDPIVRRELNRRLLSVIQDERRSVLLSSHITEDIEQIADFVAFIVDGRIVLAGQKEDILSRFRRVRFPLRAGGEGLARLLPRLLLAHRSDGSSVVGITEDPAALRSAAPSVPIEEQPTSLDDILLALVKGEC